MREGGGREGLGATPTLCHAGAVKSARCHILRWMGDKGPDAGGSRLGAPRQCVKGVVLKCQGSHAQVRGGTRGGGQGAGHPSTESNPEQPSPCIHNAASVDKTLVFASALLCVLCVLQAAVVFNVLQGAIQHRNTEWTARMLDELCDNAWSQTLAGHQQ